MDYSELSEQELIRRQSLKELEKLGIQAFPAAEYPVTHNSNDILDNFEGNPDAYSKVCLAGRVMGRRIMGNASFAEIKDCKGRIQIYLRRDDICPGDDKTMYNTVFKRLLDIGDIIGVKGHVFKTQTGEISIHVNEFTLLSKSIRPLPVVKEKDGEIFDAFTDPDQRYRMRYVDLIVNDHVKDIFLKRTKIINTMRSFFNDKGYLEVETPILQPIPGGAAARPFITHHNTLNMPLYLRVANELYLKRLLVGGFSGVYEFAKDFRNEGMDRTHNPEFTVMEIYVAYKDYKWMMEFTEEMIEKVALALHGTTKVELGDSTIDFKRPFKRVTMRDAIKEHAGIDIAGMSEEQLFDACRQLGIETTPSMGKGKLVDEIFGNRCEHHYIQPTFITDYPVEMSPLCKKHREDPSLAERFELMVNGKELANAYSELNDPIDQLERFQEQLKLSAEGDDEAMFIDHDFVRALEHAMPPAAGMGIGIDRLTMFMTNQASIQEVLLFPQMRPEKRPEKDGDDKFLAAGIPGEWIEVVRKAGYQKVKELRELNPNKLHQDICSLNKKNNLGLSNPSKDEVATWIKGKEQ